ncbi:MFS transporter [Luteococcus sp. Sow4_B9]|uniref:MFS transporter n=1 Tax=Luteococcus sp. Sow4_B9 TaxID=3438792 RepID=UPI003F9E2C91
MQQTESWQAEAQVRAWQRRAVVVLFIAQAMGGLAVGAGSSMNSLVAYEVTRDESLSGIVRIANAIGAAIVAGPLAWLAVQRGRRGALASGWLLAMVGGLITIASLSRHNLPLLVVGSLLFSAGGAANLQMRFAATDMEEPTRTGRTLSLIVWASTIGAVTAPLLATPLASLAQGLGLPDLAGVYLFTTVGLVATLVFLLCFLRPDPMRVAQTHGESPRAGKARAGGAEVWRQLWAIPLARLAVVAAPLNQAVMVAVMVLTPVHMHQNGHGLGAVSLTLSLHIAGMFAFSPVVGWLSDRRLGTVGCILVGVAIHVVALACCALAGQTMAVLNLGLFLLGLGWSFASVSSSALLVASAPVEIRAKGQGTLDALVNLGAAVAAGVAGPVMMAAQYQGLALISGACLVPIVWMAVRALRTA